MIYDWKAALAFIGLLIALTFLARFLVFQVPALERMRKLNREADRPKLARQRFKEAVKRNGRVAFATDAAGRKEVAQPDEECPVVRLAGGAFPQHAPCVRLARATDAKGTLRVTLWCDAWIVNKTGLHLRYRLKDPTPPKVLGDKKKAAAASNDGGLAAAGAGGGGGGGDRGSDAERASYFGGDGGVPLLFNGGAMSMVWRNGGPKCGLRSDAHGTADRATGAGGGGAVRSLVWFYTQ